MSTTREPPKAVCVPDDPPVLVLDLAAALAHLADDHVHALQDVQRLEADDQRGRRAYRSRFPDER